MWGGYRLFIQILDALIDDDIIIEAAWAARRRLYGPVEYREKNREQRNHNSRTDLISMCHASLPSNRLSHRA
jgi:hypothetical protein